jgi:integrase
VILPVGEVRDEVAAHLLGQVFSRSRVCAHPVEKFKQDRRASVTKRGGTRSAASVNRELELLSKIFSLAVKYGVTDKNPCSEVPLFAEDNRRTRYLTDEEEPRLLAALTGRREHLRPLVVVAVGTGMRLGDQLSLRWHQVDFQHNVIRISNLKTGRYYGMPMNQDVRRELQALKRAAAGGGYVFVSSKTGTRVKEIKTAFKNACAAAGRLGCGELGRRARDLRNGLTGSRPQTVFSWRCPSAG